MPLAKSSQETTNSMIGPNSFFTGRFYINGNLKIDGKFEGKSLSAETLYIGVSGKIKTDVTANTVFVEGVVLGNITARNRVMLLPTAKIYGDIKTPELIIQNGVILEGRCIISNDLKHSAKDLIEQEYNRDAARDKEIMAQFGGTMTTGKTKG